MISPNDLNKGLYIKLDNELYVVEDFQHIKPGKGGAFVRTKLRNLKLDTIIERTFREVEKVDDIFVEEKKLLYLYHSGSIYHFMDQESYEEIVVDKKTLGHSVDFLKDNTEITAVMYEGKIININPPLFVELKVVRTEPGVKGDTAKSGTKPAELETGITIQVPLFIEIDDIIKVDTRNGVYVERVR
ncbi:MAG: elongation factor P [Candidatus Omnitrophica bacterium]|nr:elongation factor P [Candidatus Omnitrophota bacterium]